MNTSRCNRCFGFFSPKQGHILTKCVPYHLDSDKWPELGKIHLEDGRFNFHHLDEMEEFICVEAIDVKVDEKLPDSPRVELPTSIPPIRSDGELTLREQRPGEQALLGDVTTYPRLDFSLKEEEQQGLVDDLMKAGVLPPPPCGEIPKVRSKIPSEAGAVKVDEKSPNSPRVELPTSIPPVRSGGKLSLRERRVRTREQELLDDVTIYPKLDLNPEDQQRMVDELIKAGISPPPCDEIVPIPQLRLKLPSQTKEKPSPKKPIWVAKKNIVAHSSPPSDWTVHEYSDTDEEPTKEEEYSKGRLVRQNRMDDNDKLKYTDIIIGDFEPTWEDIIYGKK